MPWKEGLLIGKRFFETIIKLLKVIQFIVK